MITIAQFFLKYMARIVLAKYKPEIIGITGSVGKTTTKDMVACVLETKFSIQKSEKNFNNEFGLPLTILGEDSPGRSPWKWLGILWRWCLLVILPKKYPEVLVLEMGVDHPGDMEYLLSIARPSIGIVTGISSSHLEFFVSTKGIAKEKGKLIEALTDRGFAILNGDDALTRSMKKRTQAKSIFFGQRQSVLDVHSLGEAIILDDQGKVDGMHLKVSIGERAIPVRLKHVIARQHIGSILASFAVADVMKVNLLEATHALETFHLPMGRFQAIKGLRESVLIDDTYNASPTSTRVAIEGLTLFPNKRKLVALGDMLELGTDEESGHRSLAKTIITSEVNAVFLVGDRMQKFLYDELLKLNFSSENIFVFDSPNEASEVLVKFLQSDDILLVKGSQGMRMEKILEKILDPSQDPHKVLCRQDKNWRDKPFVAV